MQINVTVEAVDLTTVVDTRREYDHDGEQEYVTRDVTLGDLVADQLATHLRADDRYKTLRTEILEARARFIKEQISTAVAAEIEQAMAGPIQLTNGYGEATGKSTTLRELIVAEARKFFTEKTGDYRNQATGAQRVVSEAVRGELTKELVEAVAEEKAKVVAAVRGKAADVLADAVKAALR